MSSQAEQPWWTERIGEGSGMAFRLLAGEGDMHLDHSNGCFKPGHELRVDVVRQALSQLGMSPAEVEASIDLGENWLFDHIREKREGVLDDQASFRRSLGA